MIEAGRLTTVVVTCEALKDAQDHEDVDSLIEAVGEYVRDIQRAGYSGRELPVVAMQACHADYYVSQVRNGGHGQFIGNTGMAMLPVIAEDALAGLKAMGASAHRQMLKQMMAWVKEHPDEAALQNGHTARAAALEALDQRLNEAERQQPMRVLAARWIANWPELRAVAREQYASEIERLAQLHLHRSQRRIWRSVQQISFQMTDPQQITVAAACGAVAPEPEFKLLVFPESKGDRQRMQSMALTVQTNKGPRLCVYEAAGGQLYEFGPGSKSPKPADMPEALKSFPPTLIGARLSVVEAAAIRNFARIAERNLAAEAIDLLLRKSGLDPAAMITALSVSQDRATWCAVTGKTGVLVETLADRASVIEARGVPAPHVTRAEIEHHAAAAALGRDSLQIRA